MSRHRQRRTPLLCRWFGHPGTLDMGPEPGGTWWVGTRCRRCGRPL